MEEFLLSCGKKNCRWQPELLILLFGRTRTCSFSSKILRFTLCLNPYSIKLKVFFFFPLFVCFFLHLCTFTRNWQIPGLVLQCFRHERTHSTLSAPTLISSLNQTKNFWHPEELSGTKPPSSRPWRRTSPSAALTLIYMAAGSALHWSCATHRAVWRNAVEPLNVGITEHL